MAKRILHFAKADVRRILGCAQKSKRNSGVALDKPEISRRVEPGLESSATRAQPITTAAHKTAQTKGCLTMASFLSDRNNMQGPAHRLR
jgi:hypothetical protein